MRGEDVMKTIGLLGGMSWESTAEYYRIINQEIHLSLGGLHSAKCIIHSFNFDDIVRLQQSEDWDQATKELVKAAQNLEQAGADLILICTNTMHKMADVIEESISVPLLHIVDTTAERIKSSGLSCVGLLGTKYTMEKDFYKGRFQDKHAIEVITPNEEDQQIIHHIIFNELCQGEIHSDSKDKYLEVIERLRKKGVQGIILGCTEIPLLIQQDDTDIQLFDTTDIHAKAAVTFAIKEEVKK